MDFHEVGFGATLNGENGQPFWFQLSDDEKQKSGSPWGPANPQALNRYSYVLNGPMKYSDLTGHIGITVHDDMSITYHLTHEEASYLYNDSTGFILTMLSAGSSFIGLVATAARAGGVALGATIIGGILAIPVLAGGALIVADKAYGEHGVDITVTTTGTITVNPPTEGRQQGIYYDPFMNCAVNGVGCPIHSYDPCIGRSGYCGDTGVPNQPESPKPSKTPIPTQ